MQSSEKKHKYLKDYYQKNKERLNQQSKDWAQKNSEKHREYGRRWREKNKERQRQVWRERAKIRYVKLRKDAIERYSNGTNKCACCGESQMEFLTIDHIDGGGRQQRRKIGNNIYSWLKTNRYPSGYQILCANCNQAKRGSYICPHKTQEFK